MRWLVQQGVLLPSWLNTPCDWLFILHVFLWIFMPCGCREGSQYCLNEEMLGLCWGSLIHVSQLVCGSASVATYINFKNTSKSGAREKHDLACLLPQLFSHWPLTRLMPAAMLFKNDAFPPPPPPPVSPRTKCMEEKALAKALNKIGFFHLGFAVWRGAIRAD